MVKKKQKTKEKQVKKKVKKLTGWKKELARDFLALGSWVFYVLVFARVLIKPYRPILDQLIFAVIFFFIILAFYRKFDTYSARGLILAVFTIIFYESTVFNSFALIAMAGLIYSSYVAGNDKKHIIKGLIVGVVCSIIAYYLADLTYLRFAFF